MEQLSFFNEPPLKIHNKVRLIELFSGIGAQAKAMERLGVDFEHWRAYDFDRFAVASYNAVHGTDFGIGDVTKIHATDLGIENREEFTYLLTYSFPCQDLSISGKRKGMSKGSGSRSGLLWEVERILQECGDNLPQILVMENVDQVIGEKNKWDFDRWRESLREMGYSNKYQIMNAKDYGVPQNRNRCFMVSWLGEYDYTFPEPIELKRRLKDCLEESVDEKYYLTEEQVNSYVWKSDASQKMGNRFCMFEPLDASYTHTHTPNSLQRRCRQLYSGKTQRERVYSTEALAPCANSTDWKGATLILEQQSETH